MPRVFCRFFPIGLLILATGTGCAQMPRNQVANPFFVPANSHEGVWERTVDVLHDYQFQIDRENKLEGIIETKYKAGSGLLEPWHHDSVGLRERLESSMQTIRRRAFVQITPADGGYLVGVQAYKELGDATGLSRRSESFRDYTPLQRDRNLIDGTETERGWITRGRDLRLEQALLDSLQVSFAR